MSIWIVFLRGINVGGKNILPMKELKQLLVSLEITEVETYIQSGNVVLKSHQKNSTSLANDISMVIEKKFGFRPGVVALTKDDFEKALTANPFGSAAADPKSVHLYILDRAPQKPDLERLESLKGKKEQFKLIGKFFYLFAPEGIARSKLAQQVEKNLGVSATARNWRTAQKMSDMAATF